MNEQQLLQPYHDACFITHVKKQRRLHRDEHGDAVAGIV